MKKHCVYKLVNSFDEIEYIGHSCRPDERLYKHLSKWGKFHNRNDIQMLILNKFETRLEAYRNQIQLQKQYSMVTDNDKHENDANTFISKEQKSLGGKHSYAKQKDRIKVLAQKMKALRYACPHCNKEGQYRAMQRWHGVNCPKIY